MRFQSYFNSAVKIIALYDGSNPLPHFLKKYFSDNKKHGSKDRKFIAQACFNYYRIGCLLNELSVEDRLKAAIFLCNNHAGKWNILFAENWLQRWVTPINERIDFIQPQYANFAFKNIFPFADELSDNIDQHNFIQSHLIQPDVFLRVRPHQHKNVITQLQQHNISFEEKFENCIAVNNSIHLDTIIKIDEEVVIQDYSSQRIKEFLGITGQQPGILVWDCCAGSGGKSILAYDTLKEINLTVSDVRASIIHNLQQRFQKANIKHYKSFIVDIAKNQFNQNQKFDLIICDAPCTGSGTWSRTPEQLYFFKKEKIGDYASLQKRIVSNAIKQLKPNGYFLYITCSVFKKENEEVVEFIITHFNHTLIQSALLKGYDKKANTMFAALFKSIE